MRTHHILIGYTCFGVGMLTGQGLANSIWWIVTTIIAGIACLGICVLINRQPRKKKLPVRRTSRVSKPRNLKVIR